MRSRDPQPQPYERDPHHDVARDHHAPVLVHEHAGNAGCEDQDARDLQEDGEPVDHVVGVVGGSEPREVHPRPPDREEDEWIREQHVRRVSVHQTVVQTRRGLRDGDDERQIGEQLEWRRGAVLLFGIPTGHASVERHVRSLARQTTWNRFRNSALGWATASIARIAALWS